jgi:hypothetical protein
MSTEADPEYQAPYQAPYQPEYQVLEPVYSPFWPLLILLIGLLLWSGYQMVTTYSQASELAAEFKAAQPDLATARTLNTRLYSLAQDLVETAPKDPYAAQIVKEANIQIKSNGNSAAPQ